MGFNATVVVLLDCLHEIESDPHFGKKLCDAIRYRASRPTDDHDQPGYRYGGAEATGQTQVIEVHHADNFMVVAVGGNYGRVLGVGGRYDSDDDQIVKRLQQSRRLQKQIAS